VAERQDLPCRTPRVRLHLADLRRPAVRRWRLRPPRHLWGGAIELLKLRGGQVFWREPRLDLDAKAIDAEVEIEPSPPYAGKAGLLAVGLLAPTAPASADEAARSIAVPGLALTLDSAMAASFNEVFAKPQGKDGVFLAGEPLGSVSFTAQGQ
jgi:hypothetical protein